MIKKIIAAVAGLALAAPVNAASWNDIETLVELVKGTGTLSSTLPRKGHKVSITSTMKKD